MNIAKGVLTALCLAGCAVQSTPMDIIKVKGQPTLGPYAPAIRANGFVFLSGIVAYNAQDKAFAPSNIHDQTHQVFSNLKAVLAAADLQLQDVVKVTVYLKNPQDFAPMNTIYATYFDTHKPARTTVPGVDWGRDDVLIEIDVIAKSR